ncbi:hypothetical protein [Neobacillus mesonae]|nr:hypothetical protein [Neobacillus mesonae]
MSNRQAEQLAWQRLTPKQKRGLLALKDNATIIDGRIYDKSGNDQTHRAELVVNTTESQREALQAIDDLTEHEIENGHFVFAFFESCKTMGDQYPSLTQPDLARLMFVGTYTGYRSGRLQHDNGRIIDKKALESMVGISRNKFREFYRKLIDEDILREVNGELFVNPSVFYRGPVSEIQYEIDEYRHTRLFRKTVRELYAKYTGRATTQLAIIYTVLPFLNFDTNVVCFNPQEHNEDEIKPMNLENLAALLGYKDTHKLKRALDSVKIDGQPVFWLPHNVHDKRQRRIIVNPRVVFAGKAESLRAIKVLFN